MSKRRTPDAFDSEDNPIGLTQAFAPVKGPQSVEYDTGDDPVGLTQAFGAIPDQDEPRAWDEAGKWRDFDWAASVGDDDYDDAPPADSAPADAGESEAPEADGTPAAGEEAASAPAAATAAAGGAAQQSGQKRGRHAAHVKEVSQRTKRSRRTRRVLVVLVVLLIIAIGAVGYFAYNTFSGSQQEAAQQTQEQTGHSAKDEIDNSTTDDAQNSVAKLADVPDLTALMGKPQDEAIALIGRGAIVTANHEVNEEGNPIKANLNVALTDEPADSKTGTPTVYLGLGEDGTVRQAGYSASAAALGFSQLSFSDAVNNEHAIEKTFAKIGVSIPEGSAVLPEDRNAYSTFASDGTTVVRERCSFEGDIDVNGLPCTWSSVLSYDYTTQVVTGNLNDTVRIIYVYISMK